MLGTAQIISYIAALGLAAAIPGPGMTALVARSVSGGAVTGFMMLTGLILGDLIYLSIAVFGLAVIAHTYTSIFTLINWTASFY
ncbi:LysE family translocator, partial [Salmonella enterica]|nr:LysE family translocator [Salmonella enterica]ELC5446262.1 LysE family transporter [Salmonella enterica]